VRVCPPADHSLARLLAERGYSVHDFMSVHVQSLHSSGRPEHQGPRFDIRIATPEEEAAWFQRSDAAGDWAEPDGVPSVLARCAHKPGSHLCLA
jgi:uncharacterized protein YgfB (UPF0149 family)